MATKDQLFDILEQNRGTYLSGEELANALNVSRTAVWKAISALRQEGYSIDAVTNRGYRLSEHTDVLTAAAISRHLTAPERTDLTVVPVTTSTNSVLKDAANAGAREGTCLIAEEQTAGRGRRGRSFLSPEKTGIYFSLIVRPNLPAKDALMLTTSIACAVAETIEELTDFDARIKWVNDIYVNARKVCGILTEASIDFESQGLEYAVVGVGINIEEPKDGFDASISQIAGALYPHGQAPAGFRAELLAGILNRFYAYYDALPERTFLASYRAKSLVIGQPVMIIDDISKPENGRPATAISIDDDCHLLVRLTDGTTELLGSGEVTLRLCTNH